MIKMEQDGREKLDYNKDELDAIQRDIESAKSSLISDEAKQQIQRAREEAKKEAEAQFLVNQKIKEQEALIEQLKQEKIQKEQEFNEKFQSMESKINDMVSSKAPVNVENPFKQPGDSKPVSAETMSDDMINDIEKASGEQFLGDEFLRPI